MYSEATNTLASASGSQQREVHRGREVSGTQQERKLEKNLKNATGLQLCMHA
jgi:hypothetical protein